MPNTDLTPSESTANKNHWSSSDKLDREKDAKFLSKYLLKKYDSEGLSTESFVLNINAHWGFGKTYFLTHWSQELKQQGFPIVFFNAWDSDYYEDPMVAFICEIRAQLGEYFTKDEKTKSLFDNSINKGFKLLKVGLPVITSILTKKLTGYTFDQLTELYQNAGDDKIDEKEGQKSKKEIEDAVSKIFVKSTEDAIANYEQSKNDIKDFKDELSKLIRTSQESKKTKAPIFIFIDELDRCRPTYAIELLEKIKHIFNIPGVYFIIATASGQLCHSIKSIYGAGFDAEHYLKRFFDQTYEFQKPDYFQFAAFLFEKYQLNKQSKLLSPLNECLIDGRSGTIEIFALLSQYFRLGLRDQEQVANDLYTICLTWGQPNRIHLAFMLYLIMLKHRSEEMFKRVITSGVYLLNPGENKDYHQMVDNSVCYRDVDASPEDFTMRMVRSQIRAEAVKIERLISHYLSHMGEDYEAVQTRYTKNPSSYEAHRKIDEEQCKNFSNIANYFDYVKQIGQLK